MKAAFIALLFAFSLAVSATALRLPQGMTQKPFSSPRLKHLSMRSVSASDDDSSSIAECSSDAVTFATIDADDQCQPWEQGNEVTYDDWYEIMPEYNWYICFSERKRIMTSTGIPNHDLTVLDSYPCSTHWWVELPFSGSYQDEITPLPSTGIIAFQMNGVPIYAAQGADGTNMVEPPADATFSQSVGQYWYGYADDSHVWRYHHPYAGFEEPDEETQIGYALDGFAIYGPLADDSDVELDECNGREVDGVYWYHVRKVEDVDGNAGYCNADGSTNWNYVLGCYHGSLEKTVVTSSDGQSIDSGSCSKITYLSS